MKILLTLSKRSLHDLAQVIITINWEPMTLENCGFPEYMVSTEWEPMTLYVAVTKQVNITIKCCSDPPKNMYKMGDYTRALKMRDTMCIKKCSYPVDIPHFIEEIPKGIHT